MTSDARFGVLSDLHWTTADMRNRRRSWINDYDFAAVERRLHVALHRFNELGVQGVLVLGDLVDDGNEASADEVLKVLAAPESLPVWVVQGNHDLTIPRERFEQLAHQRHGRVSLATEKEGSWIIGLTLVAADDGPRMSLESFPVGRRWGNDLLLILSHYPVCSRAFALGRVGLPYAGDALGRAAVETELLRRGGPTIVLCGHLHVRDSFADGTLLQLAFSALVEYPWEAGCLTIGVSDAGRIDVCRTSVQLEPQPTDPPLRNPLLIADGERWMFEVDWRRVD